MLNVWAYLLWICISVSRTAALGRDVYSHCRTAVGATADAVWVSWSQTGEGKKRRRRRRRGRGEEKQGRTEQEVEEAARGHKEDITHWNISLCSAGAFSCLLNIKTAVNHCSVQQETNMIPLLLSAMSYWFKDKLNKEYLSLSVYTWTRCLSASFFKMNGGLYGLLCAASPVHAGTHIWNWKSKPTCTRDICTCAHALGANMTQRSTHVNLRDLTEILQTARSKSKISKHPKMTRIQE